MKVVDKKKLSAIAAFWDTSAIVSLCCFQKTSSRARQLAETHKPLVVWWSTSVEAISALQRLLKDKYVSLQEASDYHAKLQYLRNHWLEIQPVNEVRTRAERLLRTHKLRAADALQLAAALSWCNDVPQGRVLITADSALLSAAQIEGFSILQL